MVERSALDPAELVLDKKPEVEEEEEEGVLEEEEGE